MSTTTSSSSTISSLEDFISSSNLHRKRRRNEQRQQATAARNDGTFNGVPMFYKQQSRETIETNIHCVGGTYEHFFFNTEVKNRRNEVLDDNPAAWQQRSCHFSFLCFNTTEKDFVIFQSHDDERLFDKFLMHRPYFDASSSVILKGKPGLEKVKNNETVPIPPNYVSVGGINLKWGISDIPRLKWFPKIIQKRSMPNKISYYELPEWMVMIPFHSLNAANPGHLVWDDFLPIYNILHMFQLDNRHENNDHVYDLLPLRYVLQNGERGLWASCDLRPEKTDACRFMMKKFAPLLLGEDYPYQFTSTTEFQFQPKKAESELVCAKNGVAGLGPLTDHGLKKAHGWDPSDYQTVYNYGRGGLLYDYRNYMVQNLNLSPTKKLTKPYRIVFSQKSSDIYIRNVDFERQIDLVRKKIPYARVENYTLKDLSLKEQISVACDTAIYISLCGGGAVTGMFLPKGSSVFLYYSEDGGTEYGRMNFKPALLDWDLFNAMSHLRVHWLPRNTMSSKLDENALIALIQHELAIIDQQTL